MNPVTLKEVPKFRFEDKLVHFALYFLYAYVLLRDYYNNKILSRKRMVFQTIVFPIVLGGLIEILQVTFFPPRTAEWLDWVADTAGVLLVWAVFSIKGKKILF